MSVVIPTRNRAGTLARALNSVYSQTLEPREVIVIDDGSTDATRDLVTDHYPAVRYHFQQHRGVSSARNIGIRRSRGDWVAFLDSDDEWLPDKLSAQFAAITRHPGYRICHTDEIWIRRGTRVNPMRKHAKSGGWIYEKCLPLCVISPSSAVIHKSVFRKVGAFDEALPACEDYDLWLRICSVYPVLYVERPLLRKYGGHPDQLSSKYWGMDRFRVTALEKMLDDRRLSTDYAAATRAVLLSKLRILRNGGRKRGNQALVTACSEKIERYESPASAGGA